MNNKKIWVEPDVENVCISETEYGGEPCDTFDQLWHDKNGALHGNFPKDPNELS